MTEERVENLKKTYPSGLDVYYKKLVENFNKQTAISDDVIELELNNIKTFIGSLNISRGNSLRGTFGKGNSFIFNEIIYVRNQSAFKSYCTSFINKKSEITYEIDCPSNQEHDYISAYNLAKYYHYLKTYNVLKNDKNKQDELTSAQLFLIMSYITNDNFNSNTNISRAKLLSLMFQTNEQNLREKYSDLTKYKTLENLNIVLSYFTEFNLKNLIVLVKKDIEDIQKRKSKLSKNKD